MDEGFFDSLVFDFHLRDIFFDFENSASQSFVHFSDPCVGANFPNEHLVTLGISLFEEGNLLFNFLSFDAELVELLIKVVPHCEHVLDFDHFIIHAAELLFHFLNFNNDFFSFHWLKHSSLFGDVKVIVAAVTDPSALGFSEKVLDDLLWRGKVGGSDNGALDVLCSVGVGEGGILGLHR